MMNQQVQTKSRKSLKLFLIAVTIIFIGLLLWGMNWATYARPPLPDAIAALESDEFVQVSEEPWLTFTPTQAPPNTGFIFYPGGRIDPIGYAPLLKAIAAEGYLVVVPEMPINMAVFDANVADDIIAQHPEISHWAIGGHSIGGTMAAQYTNENREAVDGLIIWASYPADNANLSDFEKPVSLIYGSLDPRVNDDSVTPRQHLLPGNTDYVRIDGGDHHQFGTYQITPEEHHATISSDDQQAIIIQSTLDVLNAISN